MTNPVTRQELIRLGVSDTRDLDEAAVERLNTVIAEYAYLTEADRAREKILKDYIEGGDISAKTACARAWIVTAGLV